MLKVNARAIEYCQRPKTNDVYIESLRVPKHKRFVPEKFVCHSKRYAIKNHSTLYAILLPWDFRLFAQVYRNIIRQSGEVYAG